MRNRLMFPGRRFPAPILRRGTAFAFVITAVHALTLDTASSAAARDQSGVAARSLGAGSVARVDASGGDCGLLLLHSDGTYENGYTWAYGGVVPPYFGAFAEKYYEIGDLCAVMLDLTGTGTQSGQVLDAYIWEDAGGEPGAVKFARVGVDPGPVALWPSVSRHWIEMTGTIDDDIWVGYWGAWPGEAQGWYVGADLNGFGGVPYTCIAPGVGYPSGWQSVSVVWGSHPQSLGIGAGFITGQTGACCFGDGTCALRVEASCEGLFLGAGTICEPNPCPCQPAFAPVENSTPAARSGGGPNAGGTLVLHFGGTTYSSDQGSYCGQSGLGECEDAVTRVDDEVPVVFHALAAFPDGASPRLAGIVFGISYPSCFTLLDYGSCGSFELPDADWPGSGTGTAVTWTPAQESQLVEVYWFGGYVYGGSNAVFSLIAHSQGALFGDDAVPSNIDPIAGLGAIGFHMDGHLPCPGPEPLGACCLVDGSCSLLSKDECGGLGGSFEGEGTTCEPDPCTDPVVGACCVLDECFELDWSECEERGGDFRGDDVECSPTLCLPVPVIEASWGEIKSHFRNGRP